MSDALSRAWTEARHWDAQSIWKATVMAVTLNMLTLYMVMVFATWSYFLDEDAE